VENITEEIKQLERERKEKRRKSKYFEILN
jgi:hypothetical protein